jgi:hypothetical protein
MRVLWPKLIWPVGITIQLLKDASRSFDINFPSSQFYIVLYSKNCKSNLSFLKRASEREHFPLFVPGLPYYFLTTRPRPSLQPFTVSVRFVSVFDSLGPFYDQKSSKNCQARWTVRLVGWSEMIAKQRSRFKNEIIAVF